MSASSSTYANDVLVSADWVEDHLEEFQTDAPDLRLVEVNSPESPEEDFPSRYEDGHIPGAIGFQWDEDLSDAVERDILDKTAFEETVGSAGITEDSTVVFYGDGWIANWFALFAYWEFKYYGHKDVRVLDGGKDYWVNNDYQLTEESNDFSSQEYTARGPFEGIRAYREDVEQAMESGLPMVDVRSPEEFTGEIIAPEGLQETAQRGGHIPGASNVPTASVLNDDGTFKSAEELRDLYEEHGVTEDQAVVTYCRVGERSSIAWFVLTELLGFGDVENYDGSWTEWGNSIRAPIEQGE
ncbi:sulfurtransferase [Halocatena salina]|uniref:Sulfurtransferase n=1 Tax=Halocatena salina TaxID=2934340 RepID=A0A8U0A4X1_9EURY|nr:rhodanese-like domain-containing protein [Halocatena salina]UPM44084.1 sulfurtransferase [Halocatena salina]